MEKQRKITLVGDLIIFLVSENATNKVKDLLILNNMYGSDYVQ